jgi:hypothetical protein
LLLNPLNPFNPWLASSRWAKPPQHDAWNEDLSRLGETLMNGGIFGEDGDNDIRIEENATTH